MLVQLVVVPPGGGETDYSLDFDLPELPRPGDYICVSRPDRNGHENFIVRRTWWMLDFPMRESDEGNKNIVGTISKVFVECEFANGPYDSESHKKSCEMYKNRGKPLKAFDETAY